MITTRVRALVERTEPRGLPLALGRSALAAATLLTIVFTGDDALFAQTHLSPDGMRCTGLSRWSVWCLAGPGPGRIISIAVLLVVLSGYRPRWTCVPHWYVAFSFAAAIAPFNGGDNIAQIVAMLLIPVCLGDHRRWQWTTPEQPLAPVWRGTARAGVLAVRLQLAVIYGSAAVAKLSDPMWRQGSAMAVIVGHPRYGFPAPLRPLFDVVFGAYWATAAITWSVIAAQVVIAVLVLCPRRPRLVAFALGAAMHVAIAALLGLTSFGLVMVAALAIATMSGSRRIWTE